MQRTRSNHGLSHLQGRFVLIILTVIGCLCTSHMAEATCYYVKQVGGSDSASGLSWSAAWRTIGKAALAMQPGDSVKVANGNYQEAVVTSRSGTATQRITFVAAGDSVFISPADDLNDASFVRTTGYANVYQLNNWSRGYIRQRRFPDIVVDDPDNASKYVMKQADGPIALTNVGITSVSTVNSVEGSYFVSGNTLYVHPYRHLVPSTAATDFWSNRNQAAFEFKHNYIVLDGFKFYYADGPNGGVHATTSSRWCEMKNCYAASVPVFLEGSWHTVRNLRATHNNFRRTHWDWITGNDGTGLTVHGAHMTIIGGELWHNWNNLGTEGDTLVVDGIKLHGSPNHNWAPQSIRGLTARDIASWNAQDGLYIKNCENILLENVTCFGGFYIERVTSESTIGVGPMMVRNCLFQDSAGGGIASYGETSTGTPSDLERFITFQNCIFFKTDTRGLFEHMTDGLRYDLAQYTQHSITYPSQPHAQFTSCRQISTGFAATIIGGAWILDTDVWDIHVTGMVSPAHDAGSTLAGGTRDFEGDVRPAGSRYDIGADEFREATAIRLDARPGPKIESLYATPNPSTGDAQIEFVLPYGGPVHLALYDAAGRHVRDLERGVEAAGHHTLVWDGLDDAGRSLRGGIYFARLEVGGATRTFKITLVR